MNSIFKHFLLLNVVVLALGWLLTNDFPERIYVTAEAWQGLVINTDCGRGCRFDEKSDGEIVGMRECVRHFWLPNDFFHSKISSPGGLRLRRLSGRGDAKITQVRVWSRLIFERRWMKPNDLKFGADGALTLKASESSFGLSRIGWVVLAGGEMGLLLLALILGGLGYRLCPMKVRPSSDTYAAVVALAVAVFCGVVVPLQTLLANPRELNLSIGLVLLALSWRVLVFAAVLAVLLYWSTRFAGALYLLIATAFLVYEYLETGLLTAGFPALDGDMLFYWNPSRMVGDALVIPIAFVILVVVYRCFHSSVFLVPGVVCILGLASLFDVSSLHSGFHSELRGEFKSKQRIVREAVYSKHQNVLVYVLDATATPYLRELFRLNPSFRDSLTGFTWYANNLGMYDITVLAVAGMVTGKYYDDVSKDVEYMYSVYSKDSLLESCLDGKRAVFFNPGSFEVGFSARAEAKDAGEVCVRTTDDQGSKCGVLEKRMNGLQPWTLLEIVRFRLMPFCLKYLNFVSTRCGWYCSGDANSERWTYPILAEAPEADVPCALHWMHTDGMHPPFGISRQGIDDGSIRDDDAAKVDKLWFVWSQLVKLLDRLKTRGIYDRSTIVITADHGWNFEADRNRQSDVEHLPARALPILLVKPPSATGPLRESVLPTSHVRIRDLVLRAESERLTAEAVDSILRSGERYYSIPQPDRHGFSNFYADAEQRVSVRFQPSAGENPLAHPIRLGHRYSLCGNNLKDMPPVRISDTRYYSVDGSVAIGHFSRKSVLQFKVPGGGVYRVSLGMSEQQGVVVEDLNSSNRLVLANPIGRTVDIDLVSDDAGIVSAAISRPKNCHPCLHSIEVVGK